MAMSRSKSSKSKSSSKGKKSVSSSSKSALNQFKMEAAKEVGVNLKQGYNGDLSSRQAGSIGGQMVKKMVESYKES